MPNRPTVLDLAKMALLSYETSVINGGIPGWVCQRRYGVTQSANGFFAKCYTGRVQGHRTAVFAIRGTDEFRDGAVSDVQIFLGVTPEQYQIARNYFNTFLAENQNAQQIILTGHSLGGGLASMISADTSTPVVTFNAPGTVNAYTNLRTLGICSGVTRSASIVSAFGCAYAESRISSAVDESVMLNVRARYDVVSVGTGQAYGTTVNVEIPTHFDFSAQDWLTPVVGAGRALGQGAAAALTQHSMANMVSAVKLKGSSFFRRYGWG